VTARRVVERGEQRRGVRRVRHHEELVVADPPHDDVVDDVRIVGVEEMRVLRAAGTDPRQVVGEEPLEQLEHPSTAHRELTEMRHVEHHGVLAAGAVLVEHARVLQRHVPAPEGDHLGAERAVLRVERTVPEIRLFRLFRLAHYFFRSRRLRRRAARAPLAARRDTRLPTLT